VLAEAVAVADEAGVLRKPTRDDSTPPLLGEAGSVGVQLADGSRVASEVKRQLSAL